MKSATNIIWSLFKFACPGKNRQRNYNSVGLAARFYICDHDNTPAEFRLHPEQKVLSATTVGHSA